LCGGQVSELRMFPPPIVERFVDLGGVRLKIATAGSGRPVVLLHGFPDSWRLWRHQIVVLAAAGYRVIAPDAMKERGLRSSWDSAVGWVDTGGAHVRSTKEAPCE